MRKFKRIQPMRRLEGNFEILTAIALIALVVHVAVAFVVMLIDQ